GRSGRRRWKRCVQIRRQDRRRIRGRRALTGFFSFRLFRRFLFLGVLKRREHFLADFGAQLVDAFFCLLTFGRARLLSDHFVVINDRGAIHFLLVVKTRDFERTGGRFLFQLLKIASRLRCFLTVGKTEQEILER